MSKASLYLSLCTLGCLYASTTQAQVTSDGTVNTQVNQNGNVAEITGGETRGDNLFHSFQDFSISTNNEAFFNNADSIANIFSRVTGGNISNIDGLIRANGSASLFLINPAGILFGENASLDLGGSFYGSTTDSILFEDGEFSAVDNIEQSILTINAPIGLGFRENPGNIVNRSVNNNLGLSVSEDRNIALLGGNISLEDGGIISAPGGTVELGGLIEAGTISFADDGSLSFPDNINRGNVSLTNVSRVFAISDAGSIEVNAANLEISDGGALFAGIQTGAGSPDARGGDITIDLTEDLVIDGQDHDGITGIFNTNDGIGNPGDINIMILMPVPKLQV